VRAQPECASRKNHIDRRERVFFFTPQARTASSKSALCYDEHASGRLNYYIHTDHIDTPRIVVDRSNNIRWRWMAEPFGTTAPEANPNNLGTFGFPPRMPGQYADAESGLFYNMARYLDSGLGAYTQSDLIGLAGGINTYAYALGAPTMYTDADGLSPLKIIALCAKGYRVIKKVGLKEAIQATRRGENVLANSHAEAKQIARAAGRGKRPIRDPAHKPEEGQMPHYHPNPRNGSHVFYSIAAAVTASNYLQCEDNNLCVEGALGQVIDFFNPLAVGQDVIDIVGGGED